MSKKGRIQTRGAAWGSNSEDLERNMRKSIIEQQWHNFKVTNDLECLAQICEKADYFGNKEIGATIARKLRSLSRRKKGYGVELEWEWALKVYDFLGKESDWKGASNEARRHRVAEITGVEEAQREKWCESLRKKLDARAEG